MNVWSLDAATNYNFTNHDVVNEVMEQLGLGKVLESEGKSEAIKGLWAFDNHPSHWIIVWMPKGTSDSKSLCIEAISKKQKNRWEILDMIDEGHREISQQKQFRFSQLPQST